MRIFNVPQGESPNRNSTEWPDNEPGPAVVICRGDTHNLWILHRTDEDLGYPELTEGQSMVFGLAAQPGTPDADYVNVITNEVSSRFSRDLSNDSPPDDARETGRGNVDDNPPSSIKELLDNVRSIPPDNEEFQRPFDIEVWNTPAGEDPKRTPLHELDRERNRS